MTDLHMHTKFSFDSEEEPANYIRAAVKNGDYAVGFSEHYDYDAYLDGEDSQLADIWQFIVDTERFKEKSPVLILRGIELGFRKSAVKKYKEIEKYPLDYIIMSVHTVKGMGDCYFPKFFEGLTKEQAYTKYLETVLESVKCDVNFQILGHLGYVARYAPYENKALVYSDFPELIDKILKGLIERSISLELNTSSSGLEGPFVTDTSILERYMELGGDDFTYGSDAHSVDKFQRGSDETLEFLLSHGVTHITIYENRKKIHQSLV